MNIEKPIIFFDLESTGVETETARIVQIAAIKVQPDGKRETKNVYINPEIPIPQEASEIHGITDEMVKDAPTFKQLAVSMKDWFYGCDLGGFNSDSYDIPLLCAEMNRAGVKFLDWEYNLVDVLKLYRLLYTNKLTDIYKRLFGKELENSHNALADIVATEEVLNYILPEELQTAKDIDEFCQGEKLRFDIAGKMYIDTEGVVRWNFSKNIGQPVTADRGFCQWFEKQDFPAESKEKLKQALNG